jgi:arylsulfatase A-like enzyme
MAAVRTEREKYVHFANLPPLHFDLASDPHEMRNLANDPRRAPEMLALAERMLDWRLAYARRELTGIHLDSAGPHHAERTRRVP